MQYQNRPEKEKSIYQKIWESPLYRFYLIVCFFPFSLVYVYFKRDSLFGPTKIFGFDVDPVEASKYETYLPKPDVPSQPSTQVAIVKREIKQDKEKQRKVAEVAKQVIPNSRPTYKEKLAELKAMPGMDAVAEQLEGLVDFLEVQRRRENAGYKARGISLHTIFKGPPGTGKTTVARIYGEILGILGVLESGHVVEVSRPELIGRYVGETSEKTNEVIDSALDGVLFIDEAYSLTRSGHDGDYGAESVDCLIKRMEDERDRLVVIIAGYAKDIDKFLQTNEGMKSRFSKELVFEAYSSKALVQIFEYIVVEAEYSLHPDVLPLLIPIFESARKQPGFGNARFARTLFEKVAQNQAKRIMKKRLTSDRDLEQILIEDLG